jgi:cytochrome bd-type quinol oxidase subunit 1
VADPHGDHRASFMPLLGNTGWIFTEMGRQPWIVFGLMPTPPA